MFKELAKRQRTVPCLPRPADIGASIGDVGYDDNAGWFENPFQKMVNVLNSWLGVEGVEK